MTTMRIAGNKRAIRHTLFRLGLHTTLKGIVDALGEQGIQVDEALIRQVLFELLKETTRTRNAEVPRPVPSQAVRRCPKGFPERWGK